MNPRIQELSTQAMQYATKSTTMPAGFYSREIFEQKFAELLISECLEVLRLVTYEVDIDFGSEEVFQEALKKHFWS